MVFQNGGFTVNIEKEGAHFKGVGSGYQRGKRHV